MNSRLLLPALLAATLALGGCAASPGEPAAPTPVSTASAPTSVPSPGAPGSTLDASAVTEAAPRGQRIALIVNAEPTKEERLLLAEAEAVVTGHGGTVTVHAEPSAADSVSSALADDPDVVVAVGPSVVGAVDLASASNLDRSFLVLGTQLAEPTNNVVAVVWPGADDRAVFADQQATLTGVPEHGSTAVELGLAAFASGLAGYVIALD